MTEIEELDKLRYDKIKLIICLGSLLNYSRRNEIVPKEVVESVDKELEKINE